MQKRLIALLLAAALCAGCTLTAMAETPTVMETPITDEAPAAPQTADATEPEDLTEGENTISVQSEFFESAAGNNEAGAATLAAQNYTVWANTIGSYLVPLASGYMTVERTTSGKYLLVRYYDNAFRRTNSYRYVDISGELPLFGGFYAGSNAYYLVTGQNNDSENDSTEVIRVTKFDTSWKRVKAASLRGANTVHPFDAGSLRMAESGSYLYIRTCHEMYRSAKDGLNHQANLSLQVRTSDMTITDSFTKVWIIKNGYISHSFNQFILVDDQNNIVALDHGDANPRSAVLGRYATKANGATPLQSSYSYAEVFPFTTGKSGDNPTGASLGGLEYSGSSYLVAGNYVREPTLYARNTAVRNVFVTATPRSSLEGTTKTWLSNYTQEGALTASTPQMVKMSNNSFLVLWEVSDVYVTNPWEKDASRKLCYAFVDGNGKLVGSVRTAEGRLSDCKPVVKNGAAVWYVSNGTTTFYTVQSNGTLTSTDGGYSCGVLPSGTLGSNVSWRMDANHTLYVSGSGPIDTSKEIPWEAFADAIERVEIGNGITEIGSAAFFYDNNLHSAVIPPSVTSIGYNAFEETASDFTIYGYYGSRAFSCAEQNGYRFVATGAVPPVLNTPWQAEDVIRLSWNRVAGVNRYRVFYKLNGGSWTTIDRTDTSFTITDAVPGTYTFMVRCVSDDGETLLSEPSEEKTAQVSAPDTPQPGGAAQSGVEGFVARLYEVCLDREADEGGLQDWVGRLTRGEIDGANAVYGFVFSKEFTSKNYCNSHYLDYLYKAVFDREADDGGKADWLGKMANGMWREDVLEGFAGSQEFKNLCESFGITPIKAGATAGSIVPHGQYGTIPRGACSVCGEKDGVTQFVERLYRVCFDREADEGGLADWTGQLWDHVSSGTVVAHGFACSQEMANLGLNDEQYVEAMYRAFFDREYDDAGKADWMNRMHAQGYDREQVFYGFAGSQEFENLCNRYGITR